MVLGIPHARVPYLMGETCILPTPSAAVLSLFEVRISAALN